MQIHLDETLEQNLFKNVSKDSLFRDKLNDVIRTKKKQVVLVLYAFTPSTPL